MDDDVIDKIQAAVQFFLVDEDVYIVFNLDQDNKPDPKKLARMLTTINSAGYLHQMVESMKEYCENSPDSRPYLEEVMGEFKHNLKEASDKFKQHAEKDDDVLVVTPENFIKYDGYGGGNGR